MPDVLGRRVRVAREHLELPPDDRERRAQLVRRVRDERRLAVEGVLEAVEHRVEGGGEVAQLVPGPPGVHAGGEVAAVHPVGHRGHAAQRPGEPVAERGGEREGGHEREAPGQHERPPDALLRAVHVLQRLADPEAHAAHRAHEQAQVADVREGARRPPRGRVEHRPGLRGLGAAGGPGLPGIAEAERLRLVADHAAAGHHRVEQAGRGAERLAGDVGAGGRVAVVVRHDGALEGVHVAVQVAVHRGAEVGARTAVDGREGDRQRDRDDERDARRDAQAEGHRSVSRYPIERRVSMGAGRPSTASFLRR